ncbi:MAG: tetratricopeptide repeat protein [Nitrospirae bacterium]|nr:tetratricopeptide repeat protein [Nitrospirota bacterium]
MLSKIYDRNNDYENKERILKEAFDINPEDPRLVEMVQKQEEEPLGFSSETEFVGTTLPEIEETAYTEQQPTTDSTLDLTFTDQPADTEQETEDLGELIAEAEFYYRQGLFNDALAIYEKLTTYQPENQEFKNKITEIKEKLKPQDATETQSLANEVEETELSALFETKEDSSTQKSEAPEPVESSFYDHQPEEVQQQEEELVTEELDFRPEEEDLRTPEPELTNDVMEIFEEFKKGIAEELEEEDYETHYNLGIAYKEMGLLDDAIKEFQIAKKDPNRKVHVMSMLGVCYMEKQLYSLAIDAYKEALENMKEKDESYWGTKFDLATAYEKNGDLKAALDIYVEIYGWDSKFRDVDKKVNNLKKLLSEDKGEAEIAEEEPPKNKDRISYI